MKVITILLTAIITLCSQQFVQPKKNDVKIYDDSKDKVILEIKLYQRLKILDHRGIYFKVETATGLIGYVKKHNVVHARGNTFSFDGTNINGYSEDPTVFLIIDSEIRPSDVLKLERSFLEELKVNTDRETIERAEED
jgi:hypothetical protein